MFIPLTTPKSKSPATFSRVTVVQGDTLCAVDAPIVLEKMDFPEPVIKVNVLESVELDGISGASLTDA